jgi:CheY-like chemotaxis protein
MTHELRTPLNGIIGMLQLLKHHNLPPEHRELVMVMDDGASMLLKIVNDILDFSKIEANEIQLENIGFDLVSVISKITMSMEPLVENKNLWMQTIFPKEDLPPVLGDPLRIGQIVSNLLSNALKYTQQGGIIVSLATTKKNNKLQFLCRVTDTGIGIASDKLDMIFQKFTQADDSTTRRFGGTGLGLSITKELVELMGGEINVSSTDNKGSSFWFTLELPITDHLHEDRVTQQQTRQRLCKSAIPIHEARFLVAEDHPLNQILIKKLLERMQPKSFMIVDNGAKALQAMQNEIYDIVLMDIHMPVMNGYNATTNRRLWEKENNLSHLPIIATTANAFAGESQKCMDAGMDDYIVKPIMESVLYEVLSQWIVFDEQQSFTYEETGENNTVPVDLALLKSFSDGDEDFEHLSIAVFLEQTDRHFEQLQNRITHDNTEQWVDIAHMLKGASGSIGAQQLKLYAVQAQLEYYQTQEKRQMIFDLLRTEYARVDAYFTMLGYSRRTQH